MLFDWAAQPFYTLVSTFIFAPYFTAHFIGDPVTGSAYWGYAMAAASFLVAVSSPILGTYADQHGRLKPMIAFFSIGFVTGQTLLWFAVPGADANLWLVIFALILATISAEYATVLNNSLMPRLVGREHLGHGRCFGHGQAMLFQVSGFHDEQFSRFELHGHVHHLVCQGLEFADGPSELLPLVAILYGNIQTRLGTSNSPCCSRKPGVIKRTEHDFCPVSRLA